MSKDTFTNEEQKTQNGKMFKSLEQAGLSNIHLSPRVRDNDYSNLRDMDETRLTRFFRKAGRVAAKTTKVSLALTAAAGIAWGGYKYLSNDDAPSSNSIGTKIPVKVPAPTPAQN